MPADPTPSPDDKAESVIRNNRGILIVVATLGALIIFAVGGMIYGIMTKSGKHSDASAPEQTVTAPVEPATSPATVATTNNGSAPQNTPPKQATDQAQILGISSQPGRLYLHIRTRSGAEMLRIYNENGGLITELEP
jgi:hypothetical protein